MDEQWYNVRLDALEEYRIGQQQIHFWFEWDLGTINERDLAIKVFSYAHYIASREWTRVCSLFPVLVCVASNGKERRLICVAQTRLTHAPSWCSIR
jgi:hypothetical protein